MRVVAVKPTQERVRELLDYDPKTGTLIWRAWRGGKAKQGTVAGRKTHHSSTENGYISISIDGIRYYAHQLAWLWVTGEWPREVDHINRDGCNNMWSNLREATRFDNNGNRIRNRKKKYDLPKGVIFAPTRKGTIRYNARITIADRQIHLGTYSTPNDASEAYLRAAQQYFGKFARRT